MSEYLAGEHLALFRLVQLTLATVFGFACIFLGYRLFAQIPIRVTNEGRFSFPKFGEAKLKVAPGIFFAVLGALVLYASIDRSIAISGGPSAKQSVADTAPAGSGTAVAQQQSAHAPTLARGGSEGLSLPSGQPAFSYTCTDSDNLPHTGFTESGAGS